MVAGTTKYGDIGQRTAAWAAREMLKHASPVLVLSTMGLTKPVPLNTADTVKFRRPKPFPISTVPLAEGVTPQPQKMQYEDVSCQLHQFGNIVEITDWVMDTSEDAVLKDATEQIGEQAGGVLEQIVYSAVKGGTNVVYANGVARNAVNTPVALSKLRACVRALLAQKAKMITRIIDSTPAYATTPVEASFVAVCHTDLSSDIRNLAGFIPTAKYGAKRLIHERELGAVEDIRFVTSPDLAPFLDAGGAKGAMVSTSGTAADVYPILIFGQESFGQVPLKGKNAMTPIVVNPKPSHGSPLGQVGYVGYKFATAAVILNELWQIRLEVAATAL